MSKNLVAILLGIISFFLIRTELEKRDRHPTLLLLHRLQTFFFSFIMFWMCLVQNGIDLVEICIFYKSEKTSGKIVRLIEIYYHIHLVFTHYLFIAFAMLRVYPFQK